jgi:hypothetical protein
MTAVPETVRLYFDWTSRSTVGNGCRIDVSEDLLTEVRAASAVTYLHALAITHVEMRPIIMQSDAPTAWKLALLQDVTYGLWVNNKHFLETSLLIGNAGEHLPISLIMPIRVGTATRVEITATGIARYQMTLRGYFDIRREDAPKEALLGAAQALLNH